MCEVNDLYILYELNVSGINVRLGMLDGKCLTPIPYSM